MLSSKLWYHGLCRPVRYEFIFLSLPVWNITCLVCSTRKFEWPRIMIIKSRFYTPLVRWFMYNTIQSKFRSFVFQLCPEHDMVSFIFSSCSDCDWWWVHCDRGTNNFHQQTEGGIESIAINDPSCLFHTLFNLYSIFKVTTSDESVNVWYQLHWCILAWFGGVAN